MTDPITAAYRAGLEAAAKAAEAEQKYEDGTPWETIAKAQGDVMSIIDATCEAAAVSIARSIRALPVPEPDPMVVTVRLEWDARYGDIGLYSNGKLLGWVRPLDGRYVAVPSSIFNFDGSDHPTETEARAALLAAVRKALGAGE